MRDRSKEGTRKEKKKRKRKSHSGKIQHINYNENVKKKE